MLTNAIIKFKIYHHAAAGCRRGEPPPWVAVSRRESPLRAKVQTAYSQEGVPQTCEHKYFYVVHIKKSGTYHKKMCTAGIPYI